jgi:peptide deformylase
MAYVDFISKLSNSTKRDYVARVVQHEVDHLDGVLIIDYEAQRTS